MTKHVNEYATAEHALKYLARADRIPHRTEGETVLLDFVPLSARRLLDIGTGDGRLLALLLMDRPDAKGLRSTSLRRCLRRPGRDLPVTIASG